MGEAQPLFVTRLWRAALPTDVASRLNAEIVAAARSYAEEDEVGRQWCAENAYPGYTSYGSLADLPTRAPCFAELKTHLDREAKAFSSALAFDLGGGRLKLDNLWVNLLHGNGFHAGHIHPNSVISGTCYAQTPKGSAALKLEDPRLPMMMAAPPRRDDAPEEDQRFVYIAPAPGMILMWESWLRHEVPRNAARSPRVSVSFNYRWS